MRRGLACVLALVCAVLLGGCLGDDGKDPGAGAAKGDATGTATGTDEAAPSKEQASEPSQGKTIRAWSRALNARDYDRAASYFADGAIVEQVDEVRLPNRTAAVAFNRSLPCRAVVTGVERDGDEIVGSFDLRAGKGPKSSCDGDARVRFRFRGGKFSEWRQVVEKPAPEGRAA